MKTFSSAIIFGVGLLLCPGSLVQAQYGNMGEAVKKGAGDAGTRELMKGAAEKARLAAPEAPTATQGADAGGATAPASEPKAAPAAANAPAADADVAPEAADAPAGAGGKTLMDKASDKVKEEGGKKMMPKLP